jgi:hypothetical protein
MSSVLPHKPLCKDIKRMRAELAPAKWNDIFPAQTAELLNQSKIAAFSALWKQSNISAEELIALQFNLGQLLMLLSPLQLVNLESVRGLAVHTDKSQISLLPPSPEDVARFRSLASPSAEIDVVAYTIKPPVSIDPTSSK